MRIMRNKKDIINLFTKYGEIFSKVRKRDKKRLHLSKIIKGMMKNIKGKRILDAGCGDGSDSVWMAKKGAKVVGIDITPKMIRLAKKRCKDLGIEFYLRDIENTKFASGSFDIVYTSFTLYLNKNLKKILSEFFRLLKKEGEFFLVDVHPIRKMVVYTGDYFDTGKHWEVSEGWKRFAYYRKMEDLLNTAISVGFTLKEIREPKSKGVEDNFYPYFLIMRFKKV